MTTKELVHGFFESEEYKEVMPDYKVEFNQELYESFLNYEPERSSNFLLGDFCQKKKRKLGSFKNYIIRTLYSTSRIYSFKFEGSPTITFQGLARLDDFKYTNWPTDQLDQINKDARRHGVKIESSEREEILRLGDKLAYTQGDMEPINKIMFMAKNTNLFFISLYLFDQILSPMEKCGTTMALDGESAFILNKLGVKIKLGYVPSDIDDGLFKENGGDLSYKKPGIIPRDFSIEIKGIKKRVCYQEGEVTQTVNLPDYMKPLIEAFYDIASNASPDDVFLKKMQKCSLESTFLRYQYNKEKEPNFSGESLLPGGYKDARLKIKIERSVLSDPSLEFKQSRRSTYKMFGCRRFKTLCYRNW